MITSIRTLSKTDATQGLSRMSVDISKALFRKLATDGVVFNLETFRTIKATYYRTALDLIEMIEMYHNDANIVMNGLGAEFTDRPPGGAGFIQRRMVELFRGEIEAIRVHDLGPGSHEVVDELLALLSSWA
jgi:hypothetical protein